MEIVEHISEFIKLTAFTNMTVLHFIMIAVGLLLIFLAITRELEPMLLIPIGFGIIIGNIIFTTDFRTPLNPELLYIIYPSLIFLGIGAMTDFSSLISNPKLILIGVATQLGIFTAYCLALFFGSSPTEAGAISIIGAADGPTAIFLASELAPDLLSAIVLSAYAYMALAIVIQPAIMKLLTSKKERVMRMKPPRTVSKTEKIIFALAGLLLTALIVPNSLPLLGMLFFGNMLKESGVTKRLADTVKGPVLDITTILIGLTVGASAQATTFLTMKSLTIFILGIVSFIVATTLGVLFVKFLNLFLKEGNKINPLIGGAGLAALPGSARVAQIAGMRYDKTNHLLTHATGPNIAGLIGSAIAAGLLLSFLG